MVNAVAAPLHLLLFVLILSCCLGYPQIKLCFPMRLDKTGHRWFVEALPAASEIYLAVMLVWRCSIRVL